MAKARSGGRGGRPPRTPEPGERFPMSFRATPFGAFAAFGLVPWNAGDKLLQTNGADMRLHLLPSVEKELELLASQERGEETLLAVNPTLHGLASGWRYTRYADDLTFSLPESHKGKPNLGALLGSVRRIVEDEGFALHPDKTRVARSGSRQKVTGLVVNGSDAPRVPRKLRRQKMRRSAKPLHQPKPRWKVTALPLSS